MNVFVVILFMAIATFVAASGSMFLKKGVGSNHKNIKTILKNKWVCLGGILYVSAALIFVWLLKSTELSFLYPLNALAYIWASFLSVKYLNEKMTFLKWLGVSLIIIGVFFVTR